MLSYKLHSKNIQIMIDSISLIHSYILYFVFYKIQYLNNQICKTQRNRNHATTSLQTECKCKSKTNTTLKVVETEHIHESNMA